MRPSKLKLSVTLAALAALLVAAESAGAFSQKLPADKRIVHALNRLTFGPRPGDIEAVQRMGLERWIEQQLSPAQISENAELLARLDKLTTLRLTDDEIMRSYPPPQILIAAARVPRMGEDLGSTPEQKVVLNAIVDNLRQNYRAGAAESQNNDQMEEAGDRVRRRFQQGDDAKLRSLLNEQDYATLTQGRPVQKAAVLERIPANNLTQVMLAMPQNVRRQVALASSDEMRRKLLYSVAPNQLVQSDLIEAKLLRAAYSERQLEEVLTDFWFNHFNVDSNKGITRALITSYERDAIRPHVLGKFRDMLGATAHAPAMLFYLDNAQSVDPAASQRQAQQLQRFAQRNPERARAMRNRLPNGDNVDMQQIQQVMRNRGLNENYARELMELHTLGVDGGYTQKDVREVARALTGWGLTGPRQSGTYGFRFNARLHDSGEKNVLGHKIPAGGGKEDGERVLDILARHPSTAKHISYRLAQRFIADVPPASLVDRMATTFSKTDGDLREVLRTMLKSDEFWSAGAYRSKVKSPLEVVVSAIRATDADIRSALPLSQQIERMGMPLYRKQEPTGYKNIGQEWVSSNALVGRMNFALELVKGKIPGVKPQVATYDDPQQTARQLLAEALSPATLSVIDKKLAEPQSDLRKAQLVTALVLGAPEFQRH